MCVCTPEIRTPYCGKPGCEYPARVAAREDRDRPRRFRWPAAGGKTPTGLEAPWNHGCYFSRTQLMVTDMGGRGTGEPRWEGLEWLDPPNPGEA